MRSLKEFAKRLFTIVIAIIFWILIWHFYACKVGSRIFLPTPKDVLKSLASLTYTEKFWRIVYASFIRILKGFGMAVAVGVLLAVISAFCRGIRIFIEPFMKLIKSVPVASFTILVLLWINSENLSVVISFFMVLPVIYINVLQGFENVDKDMLEMAKVYEVSFAKKMRFLYIPSACQEFIPACRVGIGLCFKSGIAAEVIGLPMNSIGSELYKSKLYLMTDELFAWTIVIVVMSVLFEYVCIYILNIASKRIEIIGTYKRYNTEDNTADNTADNATDESKYQKVKRIEMNKRNEKNHNTDKVFCVEAEHISKFYEGNCVFEDVSFKVRSGEVFCVMGESGIGKTTLMKIVMGIIKPDSGRIERQNKKLTAVFQEDRLLKKADIYTNIYFAMKDDKNFREKIPVIDYHLKKTGLEGLGKKKIEELSGGMCRRVALIRAVITKPDILILDEAMNGIDGDTKNIIAEYIKMYCNDTVVMMVTHHIEEAEMMGAKIYQIDADKKMLIRKC